HGIKKPEHWDRLTSTVDRIKNYPIEIDDTPAISIFDLRVRVLRLKQKYGKLGLIIVDYLQLMTGYPGKRYGTREQEIADISQSLKALAKEIGCPVIALSQLSRAVEIRGGDKRPVLSDLRESGAIEQDADLIMFIYRPE